MDGVPVFDVLGIPRDEEGTSSDLSVRRQFVTMLRVFTGGIPRFVCLTLAALLAEKPALGTGADVRAAFAVGSPVVAQVLRSKAFVQGAVGPLKVGLSDPGRIREVLEVILAVAAEVTFPLDQQTQGFVARVDRLGAYMDGDVENGAPVFRVVFPEVLRLALMASRGVQEALDRAAVTFQAGLDKRASAGAIGDRLEVVAAAYFKTYLYLSSFFGRAVPRMASLLAALGLDHSPLDLKQSVVVDEALLGRVMRNKTQQRGTELTNQSVDRVIADVFAKGNVQGQCRIFLPLPLSHCADLFVLLVFQDGTHALLLVSCKATNSAPLPDGVLAKELAKAATVVAALPPDTRKMYDDRIYLLCLEHPIPSLDKERLTRHGDAGFTEVHLDEATTAHLLGAAVLTPAQVEACVRAIPVRAGCRA